MVFLPILKKFDLMIFRVSGFKPRELFTVPPSPQGHPVIVQAGQSGRGRQFACEWGEVIFTIQNNIERGVQVRKEMREEAAKQGRDPDTIAICPAVYVTTGETQAIAEDKYAYVNNLAKPIDGLTLLSEVLNFDFATKGYDDPFTDEELGSINGLRGILDKVVRLSGKSNPTLRDFVDHSGRGTVHEAPHIVGDPKQVADELGEMVSPRALLMDLCCLLLIRRELMKSSPAMLCQNCKDAVFTTTTMPGPTLRGNLGFSSYRQK
jgi:alkanesulfonate monooxygenase SsuD/methylene tetrahydromethanopterin reductase-like flavin-dependent oxidoreductase (luciferase family)